MSTSMKIAVAEPSVIIRSGLLSVLGRLTTLNIQILEIAEAFMNEMKLPECVEWEKI